MSVTSESRHICSESLHEDYLWLEIDSGRTASFVLIRSMPVGDFEKQYRVLR